MKQTFHFTLTLALWLTMVQTAMAAITGSGTADDPYLISSTEDWNTFANNVNNGTSYSGQTVKLNADISVTTMVGTWDNPFNGTFDGGGHTLSVTLNNDSQYGDEDAYYGVAPFRFTNGATIQFLVVTGIVTTSTRKYAAGLIGMTKGGTNTILNCISSVEIYSTINNKWGDNDGTHGGFIGKASGTASARYCLTAKTPKGMSPGGTARPVPVRTTADGMTRTTGTRKTIESEFSRDSGRHCRPLFGV